jgi:hypothetical protein
LPPSLPCWAARATSGSIKLPLAFENITRDLALTASVIEDALLEANLTLSSDQITITCKSE